MQEVTMQKEKRNKGKLENQQKRPPLKWPPRSLISLESVSSGMREQQRENKILIVTEQGSSVMNYSTNV